MAMEKIIAPLFKVTALLLLVACSKPSAPDCFQSAGDNALEVRTIASVRSIEFRDDIDYELSQADQWSVQVEGPKNLLNDIETSVEGQKLFIRNNNTCNWVRSYKKRIRIRVYGPLSTLYVENFSTGGVKSVGTLQLDTLVWNNRQAAGTIELELDNAFASIQSHTGVADVNLHGAVEKLELFNQGVGVMDARKLMAQNAFVNNSSINDVYVNAVSYLFAYGQYSGNVYYKPYQGLLVDPKMTGSGQLKTY
jgi:hypothetical protein